jgi:glycerol-1-phosphatase
VVSEHDGFLIDLDGVIYVGNTALPGAARAIAALRGLQKQIMFLTNDPRSSRLQYRRKLEAMGIEVEEAHILTAGYATAAYLQRHEHARGRRAFVIGSPALYVEMEAVGLVIAAATEEAVDFVVVGGHDRFDYNELRAAMRFVHQGARLFATGRDATFPMPDGAWPGTGAILSAVETAAGISATTIGKPEPYMFQTARRLLPDCKGLVVIGDRIDSDIEGGNRAGLTTVLIGERGGPSASLYQVPDLTVPSLAALVE